MPTYAAFKTEKHGTARVKCAYISLVVHPVRKERSGANLRRAVTELAETPSLPHF